MEDNEQDKSELPTPFKLKRGREKGMVARGVDLGFAAGLAAFLACFWMDGQRWQSVISKAGRDSLVTGFQVSEGTANVVFAGALLLLPSVKLIACLAGAIFLVVLLFELVQTGFVFSAFALKPDFNRLNPGNNLKRLFSLRILIETIKNIVKLASYTIIAWLLIRGFLRNDAATVTDARSLFDVTMSAAFRLLAACLLAAAAFAVLDQIIVRRDFLKKMRMSKRELRREMRDREGEPRLKQRRKQLHGELVKAGKSMRNVRNADVLVTNPTHYAVALKYEAKAMDAPTVVAAGANKLAERLKQLAFLYGVPTIEDRVLARELYMRCAIDKQIPETCFQSVARIYNAMRRARRQNAEAAGV